MPNEINGPIDLIEATTLNLGLTKEAELCTDPMLAQNVMFSRLRRGVVSMTKHRSL